MVPTPNNMSTNDDTPFDIFAAKFNIPSISSDMSSWDKAWEKVLRALPSKDVYSALDYVWDTTKKGEFIPQMQEHIHAQVRKVQEIVKKLWDDLDGEGYIYSVWMLLDEGERKRHLWSGLKKACEDVAFEHNARALCPEITTSAMLQRRGKAFIDFVQAYAKALKDADTDELYLLPSDWWQAAVDMPEPWPENVKFAYTELSIQRNEFIGKFVAHSLMSVLRDLCDGSPGMDPVKNYLESDNIFASACATMLGSLREKPLIRCENCTKCPEEIGENTKFKVCSSCRSKLNFLVHYCSQKCQREDWPNHKKYCGKKKVSKDLPGTARDPFWAVPDPPEGAGISLPPGIDSMPVTELGFGTPHPSRPHSPALQRQVSLLTGDKEADYFLFDDLDRPIRFAINHAWLKMCFRILRSQAMFSADNMGAEAVAEHLIKAMSQRPELSKERMLAQFSREYGEDFLSKFAVFERRRVTEGRPGMTFLEEMRGGLPRMMEKVPVSF